MRTVKRREDDEKRKKKEKEERKRNKKKKKKSEEEPHSPRTIAKKKKAQKRLAKDAVTGLSKSQQDLYVRKSILATGSPKASRPTSTRANSFKDPGLKGRAATAAAAVVDEDDGAKEDGDLMGFME